MALEEAAAWLDGALTLPIDGKKYRVPEPSAELGLRLEVMLTVSDRQSDRYKQVLSDQEERDLYADVLGDAYGQLVKAGVSYSLLKLAAVTAMYHFVISPAAAERVWNDGVRGGKAPTTGARSSSSRRGTRSTTAAASTTKPRASTSGTRSRRSS